MDLRHSQLVLIEKRVEAANDKINEILQKLGWTRQQLIQWHKERKKLQTCPFNKRHVVPEMAMKEHYRRCLLKSRNAKKLKNSDSIPSSLFFYKNAPSVISFVAPKDLDMDEHRNVIDTTLFSQQQHKEYYVKELEPIPSTPEKCQAYDQVIQRSNQLFNNHHRSLSNDNNEIDRRVLDKQKKQKNQAYDEREQLNRRRRTKYRVKMKMNAPTEIQRELIDAYMQEYSKQWKIKNN